MTRGPFRIYRNNAVKEQMMRKAIACAFAKPNVSSLSTILHRKFVRSLGAEDDLWAVLRRVRPCSPSSESKTMGMAKFFYFQGKSRRRCRSLGMADSQSDVSLYQVYDSHRGRRASPYYR